MGEKATAIAGATGREEELFRYVTKALGGYIKCHEKMLDTWERYQATRFVRGLDEVKFRVGPYVFDGSSEYDLSTVMDTCRRYCDGDVPRTGSKQDLLDLVCSKLGGNNCMLPLGSVVHEESLLHDTVEYLRGQGIVQHYDFPDPEDPLQCYEGTPNMLLHFMGIKNC